MTLSKVLYTAKAVSTGGRTGMARTDDGLFQVKLDKPVAMGGQAAGTNPEELFACGYAACFGGTLDFLARSKGNPLSTIEVRAEVDFGPRPAGGYGVGVRLAIHLPELSEADARLLVDEAHKNCPYSNATRGNIDVEVTIV
jgi:osmotically inducible protein OsmC